MLARTLFDGIALGAIEALFALALALVVRVRRVVNLAQAFYFALGAWVALHLAGLPGLALPGAAVAGAVAAIILDTLLLARAPRGGAAGVTALAATLGAGLACAAGLARLGEPVAPPDWAVAAAWATGPQLSRGELIALAGSLLAGGALLWALAGTRLGLGLRAVADQPEAAALMGLQAARFLALASALGGALAGLAGALGSLGVPGGPAGFELTLSRGAAAILLGGVGNLSGAAAAGLLLGVVEALGRAYLASVPPELLVLAAMLAGLGVRGVARPARATAEAA